MKIAVLGAGAVGLCIAAKLSKVCDVYAAARKRHTKVINDTGLVMTGIWGEETYKFRCGPEIPAGERFDYIIITSKATDTRNICEQFKDVIKGTPVLNLQNGLGNEEISQEYTDKVIGGMIITGFEWVDDAKIHVSVEAAPLKIGLYPKGTDEDSEKLVELFKKAGINVESEPNMSGALWGKTLYNSALNPLGAIMRVPYGELLNKNAWMIIEDIVKEAFAVSKAEGVTLAWKTPEEYLEYLKTVQIPATKDHHSSMYQSIEIKRKTEIDFMNGKIAELGRKHGISVPANEMIVNLIKFKENLTHST